MKNRMFSYDEIVVGLILKFGSIDVFDISVLVDMIGIDNFSGCKNEDMFKYICKNNEDRFEFNRKMIKRNYECVDDFNTVVHGVVNSRLKNFLDNMDLFEFVLRKIEKICMLNQKECNYSFSELEKNVIDELKRLGYVVSYSNQNVNGFDYNSLKLSKKGILYLFLIDNDKIIKKFTKLLKDNGYNDKLLEMFLIVQDLDNDIKYIEEKVFTIDYFCQFCDVYDVNPYVENSGYSKIKKMDN